MVMAMVEQRWAPFLLVCNDRDYAQSYRDDSLEHTDYKKGIHISVPNHLNIEMDSEFDYGGNSMKPYMFKTVFIFKIINIYFVNLKKELTNVRIVNFRSHP